MLAEEKKAKIAYDLYQIVTETKKRHGSIDLYYDITSGCLESREDETHQNIYLYHLNEDSPDVISIMALCLDELERQGIFES